MNQRPEQLFPTQIGSRAELRTLSLVVPARKSPIAREWRRYDRMLGPAGRRALDAARLTAGERVLDVAAGTGGMTLEAAHRVGPHGAAVGIDGDVEAIRVARTRAAEQILSWVTFAVGELEHAELPVRVFDAVISRFGLSNVDNPAGALARLAATLVPGGRLAFVCWRSAAENAWFTLPRQAVADCLGVDCARVVEVSAQGPRPFAFAERSELESWLRRAGFSAASIDACDEETWIGDDVDDAIELFFETDGRGLDERLDQKRFERLTRELRKALVAYERPDGVRVPAGAWIVSARI